ncbi:MAG TPA: response regulator, partial [Candidatus Obscuribacterales bacterium]
MTTPPIPPLNKILVIDDCDSIRKLIHKILKVHGYAVIEAGSAEEGLKLADEEEPELVICDVHMPDHDGFYVLEQLRQDQRFQLMPFIFVSGEAVHRQDVRKGMNRGADDYIFKPFTADELVEAVQTRLERHALFRHHGKGTGHVLHTYQRLEQDLQALLAVGGHPTIFTLDIDRFKRLNDALGFQSADQLLKTLMQRFDQIEEFETEIYHGPHAAQVVLLAPTLDPEDVPSVARQLLSLISDPLNFQGYQLHLTCSVGIYTADADAPEEILKKAYIAMNQAKQHGGNMFMVYQQDMHTSVTRQLIWENELHQALSHKWFVLHYQPQIDLISGEIKGVEALIRLQHPELGL